MGSGERDMEQIRNKYKILTKPLKERDHLEDADLNKDK
jgi:hypothetical protein